jgi:hypothetical protein
MCVAVVALCGVAQVPTYALCCSRYRWLILSPAADIVGQVSLLVVVRHLPLTGQRPESAAAMLLHKLGWEIIALRRNSQEEISRRFIPLSRDWHDVYIFPTYIMQVLSLLLLLLILVERLLRAPLLFGDFRHERWDAFSCKCSSVRD